MRAHRAEREKGMAIEWKKYNQFTGEPYKKNPKSGAWNIVEYVSGDIRIKMLPDGSRELRKGNELVLVFKTLKAAKEFAETI